MQARGDAMRMEVTLNGRTYSAELPTPDLRGYTGHMSTYSGLHRCADQLLWQLAGKVARGMSDPQTDPRDGLLGPK